MQDIRNIAVIAHVDHGKTTLVDGLLKQAGTFSERDQVEERVMDSNALEKERGITILSKNTAISYKGTKINIIDTPGHADFGGEVERVLKMVDAVLLLVDAQEGVMPQTKFVVKKAVGLGLKILLVVNKIDKPAAEPMRIQDEVFDLLAQMDASDEQLDFPVVYAAARNGMSKKHLEDPDGDLTPMFEMIMEHTPKPTGSAENPLQLQVFTLDYDNYVGKVDIKPTLFDYNRKTGELLERCYLVCEIPPTICVLIFFHRFGRNTNDGNIIRKSVPYFFKYLRRCCPFYLYFFNTCIIESRKINLCDVCRNG
jgi:GTP-binding protein